jgi:hypothetical protein
VSFDIYPLAPSEPLSVPAGTLGPPVAIRERAAIDPVSARTLMHVRVAQLAGGDPATPPTLMLAVDGGPATPVTSTPTPLAAQPDAGQRLAMATLRTDPDDDIHLIEIELIGPGHTWTLQIGNTDDRDRRYIWVVAATSADTRQPWLDIQPRLFALPTQTSSTGVARQLTLTNYGTGPLTLADPDGTDLGAGFRLTRIDTHDLAGNRRASARIEFVATTPGLATTTHVFASSDPAAGPAVGHNNTVKFTASAPAWFSGDILALIGSELSRLDPATHALTPVASSLTGAVDVCVDPTSGDALVLGRGIQRVHRQTGRVTKEPAVPLTDPLGLVVNASEAVVVLDRRPERLILMRPPLQPQVTRLKGLDGAQDIAAEQDDNVVVICDGPGGPRVLRIADTGETSPLVQGGDLSGPTTSLVAVAVEQNGTILVLRKDQGPSGPASSGTTLLRVDPRTRTVTLFVRNKTLGNPNALAVAGDGTILAATGGGVFAFNPRTGDETNLTRTRAVSIAAARV